MPQPLGNFAHELFERAAEYLEAFAILADDARPKRYYASYFLLVHALELFLKSYLAAKGEPKVTIRRLGHELKDIFTLCEKLRIPAAAELKSFTLHMQEMNRDHDFRYPSGYNLNVPRPTECIRTVDALREAIFPIVNSAALIAQLNFAADTHHLKGKKIVWSD
ncbi:HEPN domain-containing protein [Mesorhizobium sp. M0959]|uniref:hypothetical protein n=1 Tax=Mesorhizobium sp. M0959 TaxID=2957034 RepID=UPI00333B626B